jgi:hypothetical protein
MSIESILFLIFVLFVLVGGFVYLIFASSKEKDD